MLRKLRKFLSEEPKMAEKAREVAKQKVRELNSNPDTYTIQAEEEPKSWRVMFFINDKRIRGGGFEITVDKQTYQVQNVRHYQ
jgi:hypothetical protein